MQSSMHDCSALVAEHETSSRVFYGKYNTINKDIPGTVYAPNLEKICRLTQ